MMTGLELAAESRDTDGVLRRALDEIRSEQDLVRFVEGETASGRSVTIWAQRPVARQFVSSDLQTLYFSDGYDLCAVFVWGRVSHEPLDRAMTPAVIARLSGYDEDDARELLAEAPISNRWVRQMGAGAEDPQGYETRWVICGPEEPGARAVTGRFFG
ncbi:hypothetical protein C8N35_11610 [Breoghania corrubedonensis]|uniref:Uncharacterized protein n=1 Tax=Breoghania corrubedonensis TaxID=665038 RepID=A0A2T5UPX5_9HYPH|nr:hypothetical protein [Breoghania corrubedonensis]PTW53555.1 hypothetical protein C8N35_11610 [Breoghania corrubedonensis]